MVKSFLQLEGIVVFLLSLYFYHLLSGDWIIFIFLLFTPDIFMVGYFWNKKLGSILYNIGHTYITPAIILIIGSFSENNLLILGAIILTAHIGVDRFFGYGLKYSTGFKDTHLQKV